MDELPNKAEEDSSASKLDESSYRFDDSLLPFALVEHVVFGYLIGFDIREDPQGSAPSNSSQKEEEGNPPDRLRRRTKYASLIRKLDILPLVDTGYNSDLEHKFLSESKLIYQDNEFQAVFGAPTRKKR